MKKLTYLVAFGGLLLASSCQKEETAASKQAAENKENPYKKMDGAGKPLRFYRQGNDDCYDYETENCASDNIVIWGDRPDTWLTRFLNWMSEQAAEYKGGAVEMMWSSPVPSEPVFRTQEYDNLLLTNFSNLGISTQAQLDHLDNETFYTVLFPDLPAEQRAMLYSRNYNTMLGRSKQSGKSFIFIAPKNKTTLQDAYANLVFVIPFTYSTR